MKFVLTAREKFGLSLALTFYPLPRGEEMTGGRLRFCGGGSGQSRRGFFKQTADDSPAPPTGVGPVAERRDDNGSAIHGWVKRPAKVKVPRGTAEKWVAVRKWWPSARTFRPGRDF